MDDVIHCPVCGMLTTPDYALEVQGVDYSFCSSVCMETFEQHPDMYIDMDMTRMQEKNQELELVRKETITCLSVAAEYKDNETGNHIRRMAACCEHLATLASLDASYISLIRDTSPMHDVGKIGVPEQILLKQGSLNEAEWKIIRLHPEIGAKILGVNVQSDLMSMASVISMTHHEKWDGSGYPKGLKAETIPLEGRIVAICDVFDALSAVRPYKKAWSVADIKRHFELQQGIHFDPVFTRLFLENFADFCAIAQQWQDKPS